MTWRLIPRLYIPLLIKDKKICQVGMFREFKTGGNMEFPDGKKTTMVFGRNTKGRSSVPEVFQRTFLCRC